MLTPIILFYGEIDADPYYFLHQQSKPVNKHVLGAHVPPAGSTKSKSSSGASDSIEAFGNILL